MEKFLKEILLELQSLKADVQTGFEGVNKKLDTIYAQVAHNTEQEVKLTEIGSKVEDHDIDIKLIKR